MKFLSIYVAETQDTLLTVRWFFSVLWFCLDRCGCGCRIVES